MCESIRVPRAFALVALLVSVWANLFVEKESPAATKKYWELSPYRVKLHLVVDDSRSPRPDLGTRLSAELAKSIRASIYPLWRTDILLASGIDKDAAFRVLQSPDSPLPDGQSLEQLMAGCDKHIYLGVVLTRLGAELSCRELDCTTRRFGAVQQRLVRQSLTLSASCLELICETFSPIATVRSLPDSEDEVVLNFRGSDLPLQTNLDFIARQGEMYQPIMLRTSSSGEIQPDTIRDIAWTYLSLSDEQEDGWHAKVHTGTRRPFGVRRRGRIQHYALALRNPTGSTRVRFYARHDEGVSLTGYEVFRREPNTTESTRIGLTDADGSVAVEDDSQGVTLLFLRSEGQLLAKLPVVPGATPIVEVPIADDTARLRAQSALTSLSEQLIDTVAMRNILIARVRDRIKNGNIEEAQELFTELDELPGVTYFDQEIQSAKNRDLHRSDDPKVQARIDKLFADTRKLLGRFLNIKPITEVRNEITSARRGGSG